MNPSESNTQSNSGSRREFFKNTGKVAAATALAGVMVPKVHAAEDSTIQIVLVGCGGRGGGAAVDALSSKRGPIKIVALADVFEDHVTATNRSLKQRFGERGDVPKDHQFVGFDAYQKAMDCLKPGDIAIFATPLAFRWVHFTYAIKKGLNVFMEKPLTADGPTSRKMIKLGEEASAKGLKVGVGLMSRHSRSLQQLADRVHGGEIGEIVLLRGYRMHQPVGSMQSRPRTSNETEVAHQIRNFHSFLWASGGCFSDFYIHLIDSACWMKNAWPVQAQAIGGRHYRGPYVDQNFDIYGVEYTYADGTKFFFDGRCMTGCTEIYNSAAHGTKGTAVISNGGDCGAPSSIFKGFGFDKKDRSWESKNPDGEHNPYQNEWNDLIEAVRDNKPYNEIERGVKASLTTSMGRMAAHTGRIVTFDEIYNSKHEFAPTVDRLTMEGPAPVMPQANGLYPVPQPGIVTDMEYASEPRA